MKRFFYSLYQWFVYIPLLIVITSILSTGIILFTLLLHPLKGTYLSLIAWGRLLCYATLSGVTVRGRENIDKKQSYIFVSNHQGAFDIFLVYGFLNKDFRWIMKKELRRIPLVGKACEVVGHIFIDRSNVHSIKESLEKSKKTLESGKSVVVFPEGSRTFTGEVGPFKRGAYQLAVELQVPIVPLTIDGAFDVLPRFSTVLSPGHFNLTIHPPISTVGLTHSDISRLVDESRATIISAISKKDKA